MCGIAGQLNIFNSQTPLQSDLEKMIFRLQHRGPDDYGFYIDNHIGLAHARLSIIDINGGHQPMHDHEKNITIVFNGEIFNFIELRAELTKLGHKFQTNSDTEVIIYLYKEYDLDFVNHLNGQFSIALWDKRKKRLLLVRDRVGISPLFYYKQGDTLLFASEVKAIIPCMTTPPSMDHHALDQLFTFWAPVSSVTLFKGVFEVKPGEMLMVENGNITSHKYWDWVYPKHSVDNYFDATEEQLADELHDKLVEATKLRLRSDVPVAAYLSGGLDSSALVSIIHHHGNVPLRTFSLGFEDKNLDETNYQKQLISHLSAEHSSLLCTSSDISDSFEKTIWHTESSILRTAPTPMMLLSQLVNQCNYKVVLTGEGADEVFGGYDIFKEGKIRQFWSKNINSNFRPLILKKLYPYLDISSGSSRAYLEAFFGVGIDKPNSPFFAHMPRWDSTSKIKNFYSDDFKTSLRESAIDKLMSTLHQDIDSWHPFNKSQYIESKTLMSKYLLCSQGDRMLMANSVEGRFPFLDHNVIEFAQKLNPKLKMKVLNEKFLLKKSMNRYLPREIVQRHKQPYRAPDIAAFFSNKPSEYVLDMLSKTEIDKVGYFNSKRTDILLKKIRAGRAVGNKDNMALVAILSTQIWHNLFIKNHKFN